MLFPNRNMYTVEYPVINFNFRLWTLSLLVEEYSV